MGGISIWQLLIIAAIVVVLFGTNKLRTLGSDLGASIKGFKKSIGEEAPASAHIAQISTDTERVASKADAKFDAAKTADQNTSGQNKEQV